MKIRSAFELAVAIILCQLAGVIGTIFTSPAIDGWYIELVKPAINPPGWVFGPVWTILYILMGIAAFLVWKKGIHRKDVKIALGIFGLQLVLNTLWSILFFGLQSPFAALVEITFLWLAIVATILAFTKISKVAAWLMTPYLLWVSFALYLNYLIWSIN